MMHRSKIVIHHSLTEDSKTVSWRAIEKYHMVDNGWSDIGYHAGVEQIDGIYVSLLGRDWTREAAAVKELGMNRIAMHVCCVGNYDLIEPSEDMLLVLVIRVLRPWLHIFNLQPSDVRAHRDYAPYKSCPGNKFNMDKLRGML